MLIDSHCHLDQSPLFENLDAIINRATAEGVKYILSISTTLSSFEKIKKIVNNYNRVYGTIGIHPHETKNNTNIKFDNIIDFVKKNKKIVGIGETGLDFYYNHSDKKIQQKSFVEHIQAAQTLNIPLIVHTRSAEKETLDILKSEIKNSYFKTLIHCFTGSNEFSSKLLDLGCFISLSGIVTFPKSKDLVATAKQLPLDRLLIETDAPYLSPHPLRGKVNEPSYIKHTAKHLSYIKNVDYIEIKQATSNNFLKLFSVENEKN